MNEAIVCKPNPVKILSVSTAPLRKLLTFLIYGQHTELLTERARRQPALSLAKISLLMKELGNFLKVESRDRNSELFFNCEMTGKPSRRFARQPRSAVLDPLFPSRYWFAYFVIF